MARLEGIPTNPKLLEQFDYNLEQARRSFATIPASLSLQQETIRNLRSFMFMLESTGDDRRRQINVIGELLEDIASHLPWASGNNDLQIVREEVEPTLRRMTAQMPIRFTRILLGGDAGPVWVSGFLSGSVTDAKDIQKTSIYLQAVHDYPEIKNWPALSTVYAGRNMENALGTVDARAFDLEIMNRAGDEFLKESGVRWLSGPYQTIISSKRPAKECSCMEWYSERLSKMPAQDQDERSHSEMKPTM